MGSPSTGYDINAKLNSATSKSTSAVSGGINSITKTASMSSNSVLGSAVITGVGKVANKAATKTVSKASDALQAKLGGSLDKLKSVGSAADKIKSAVSSLGNLKDKLPGVAGKLTKSVGGAGNVAGLANSLGSGLGLDEQTQAATAATSLINSKLTDTVFTAKPDDKMVVADAYGIKDNTTINTVVEKVSGSLKASLTSMGGVTGIGKNLLSGVLKNGNLNLDTNVLKNRLVDQLGGKAGIINKLSGGLQAGLTEIGLPPNVYSGIEATIAGVTSYLSTNNVQDARGTFNLLSRILGESDIAEFLDVGAQASLMSSITRELIDLGVPDAITVLMERSQSDEASYYALQSNIIAAAGTADLKTLNLMHAQMGSQRMLSDCPDLIEQVLKNYRFPMNTSALDYAERFNELNTLFTKLDQNWGYVRRGGVYVTSTEFFTNLSPDANTLLSNMGPFQELILFSGSYHSQEVRSIVRSCYPLLQLPTDTVYKAAYG